MRLDCIELRRQPAKKAALQSTADTQADRIHPLCLVNADGSDVVTFDGLTEGDARRMAGGQFTDFRNWFVKVNAE